MNFLQSNRKKEYPLRYQIWINIIKKLISENLCSYDKILDIGCGSGDFKTELGKTLNSDVYGIEPTSEWVNEDDLIFWGYSHKTPFKDSEFDFIILISVFEHIQPKLRKKSIKEIRRILKPGGLLFIQMPNPKNPIEFHTRLPFVGFLPRKVQIKYVKVFRKRGLGFWSISLKKCLKYTNNNNFKVLIKRNYRYPRNILPISVRKFYFVTRIIPMGSYALLRKNND